MNRPDPELLEIFSAEQGEHLRRMRALLERPSTGAIEELLRSTHTLKGASRAAGFEATEMLMHTLEGVFARLRSGEIAWDAHWKSLVQRALDMTEDILASAVAGRGAPKIDGLIREIAAAGGETSAAEIRIAPMEAPAEDTAVARAEFVRIKSTHLDELMSASSELVAATEGTGAEPEVMTVADRALREWARLRQDAAPSLLKLRRDPQFDPVMDCVEGAERELRRLSAEIRNEAAQRRQREWGLRRLADHLDETAVRVRMVGADTVFGGFGPMLRDLAQEHHRQIEFRAEGLELPADRLVLQALKDPVMHLLRNALSHGIETERDRIAAGKVANGTIRLLFRTQGDRLQVTVEDDGSGLDRRALTEEAKRRGAIRDEQGELSDEEVADLIFLDGFSTSPLTTLSGRGMGLSIVRHEVARLHGEIRVRSEAGRGTAVTLSVPVSISSQQVLLVEAGGHSLGILASFVERLCRVRTSEIRTFEGKPAIVIDARPVGLARLSEVLGFPENRGGTQDVVQIVVIAAGERRGAVMVDRLADVREVVIKPTGLDGSNAGFSTGAVGLPDGSIAVILNIPEVLDRFREIRATAAANVPEEPAARVFSILVVDDSLTTRSLEKSLLEAHGYRVHLAVDGIDALEKLRAESIDLVITDIMMPRMDGFQLLDQIRRNATLQRMPVIIVSSVENREDQERGLALGADAYVVKRKFDQRDLLETVRQIL